MINFIDVIQGKFIQEFSAISMGNVLLSITLSFLLSLFIVFIYRSTYAGVNYSSNFAGCLMMIPMVTTLVILVISSNMVLSLGMVGALSIVRFRTAVKDPLDLAFLFWSISVGIICGAGLAQVAVILSVIITVGILVLDQMPVAKAPMILVVNAGDLDAEEAIVAEVKKYVKHLQVKSRNLTDSSLDLVIELRTGEGSALVRDVKNVAGVTAVSLLAHDGEVTF